MIIWPILYSLANVCPIHLYAAVELKTELPSFNHNARTFLTAQSSAIRHIRLAQAHQFWTYKFLTDCNSSTRAISNFGIPICSRINAANITVEEKIDGCGIYSIVPFELITNDPNFGPAPIGFQYLKVNTSGRFDKGLSVEYRISIIGNYNEAVQPIKVKAATVVYTFGCGGCFIVPSCNADGKLLVSKDCSTVIDNNQATLT